MNEYADEESNFVIHPSTHQSTHPLINQSTRAVIQVCDEAAWGRLNAAERATFVGFFVNVYGSGCFEAESR